MWVQKTKSGKYAFTERYTTPQGARGTVSVTLDKNTPQSRNHAQRVLYERIRDKTGRAGEYTLSEAIDKFIAEQRLTVKKSTWTRNESVGRSLCDILRPDIKIHTLTAGYVIDRFLATGRPAVTLNEYIKRLKALLRWAYRKDLLPSTTCADKLTLFKDTPKREKIKDKYMSRRELKSVLDAMQNDSLRLVTEFLALSGLRIGEALALTTADITPMEIIVNKTYNSAYKTTTPPKTLMSDRRVHIQPELSRCIHKLKTLMIERKLLIGCSDIDLFLVNTTGGHFSYAWYAQEFRAVTQAILGRKLSPHSLRHTHASILMESLPIEVISRRLGHENSRITREIYAHVTEDLRQKDAELLDAAEILC